jgi:hypothetical protein
MDFRFFSLLFRLSGVMSQYILVGQVNGDAEQGCEIMYTVEFCGGSGFFQFFVLEILNYTTSIHQ